MSFRLPVIAALLVALAVGCTDVEKKRVDPTDFTGTVKFTNGNPVKDVTITFQPTEQGQLPGTAELKADGKFSVKLIPGKYTFMFEGKPAGLKAIPPAYQQNDSAHSVEAVAGKEITVTVN